MALLPTRTIETETGITIDLQHNDGRDGKDPCLVYLVFDGQIFAFTKSDAARIGDQLQAFAREMRSEDVMQAFAGPGIPSAEDLGIFPPDGAAVIRSVAGDQVDGFAGGLAGRVVNGKTVESWAVGADGEEIPGTRSTEVTK